MQHNQQQQQPGMRQHLTLALNVCVWLGWQLSLLMSKPGTVGYRHVRSVNAGISLLALYLWALAGASEGLLYGGSLLALASMAEHRLKSARGGEVHSYSMGESRFAARLGERRGRALEAFLAAGLGLALLDADPGAGSYLVCAALGHALTLCYVHGRAEAVDQDVLDAQIEAAARAGRREDRPLF